MSELNTNFIMNKVLPYVKQNNTSNNKPYHNLKHLLIVYEMCYDYIKNNSDVFYPTELLVAALFHDFDHTGTQPDQPNIDKALEGVTKFHELYPDFFDLEIVKNIISSTLFSSEPKNLTSIEEYVINDADMGVYFLGDLKELKLSQLGLAEEFNQSYKDFLNGTVTFINNLEFNTDYYKTIWENGVKDKTMENITILISEAN